MAWRMDALIRIVKTPFPERQWSFQLSTIDEQLTLSVNRMDVSEGWATEFTVSLQNHLGEYQHVLIPISDKNCMSMEINPYIGFRMREARSFWKIPPHIFQTWKAGSKTPEMEAAISSFTKQPGYTHICWDDDTCLKFLQDMYGDRHANAYKLLVPGAYRADFWRYCMLYKFGGVYADAKTSVLRPLDEILRPDDELVLVRDLPETCLLNGFIACIPRHPLIGLVIDMVLERIEARSYGDGPLDITGPHIFGKAFCRWKGYQENTMALFAGCTRTIQMLARHEDKKHIISPEGERLFVKEYDTYYQNDMDVSIHYPQLWAIQAVYADQPPYVGK